MGENKNKEKCTNFKSINGHTLKLYAHDKAISLRIVVLNSTKALQGNCVVLILLMSVEAIFLTFSVGALNIIIVFLCILLLCYRITVAPLEENLVIVRGLGVHVETKYVIGSKALFIPQDQVQKIFINEIILKNKIVFMLTLLAKDEHDTEKLIPLFLETLPRLRLLTLVYNLARKFI